MPERKRATTPIAVENETNSTNEARFAALHRAIITTTPEAARLYSDLARAGVPTPPEARTLVQMKQRGTPHDELVAYVRMSFPNDTIARAVALRWLNASSEPHVPLNANPPRALGDLVRRDAN